MVSTNSILQSGSLCDDSTGSVGGDSETNTTIASSPGFDPPTTKVSPMIPESVNQRSHAAYDNLSTSFPRTSYKLFNTATCVPSTFPSPGSAFTELHPRVASYPNKPQVFIHPQSCSSPTSANSNSSGVCSSSIKPISSASAFTVTSSVVTNPSERSTTANVSSTLISSNPLSSSTATVASSLTNPLLHVVVSQSGCHSGTVAPPLCRVCGQSHDVTSSHVYNYTQTVDADLCCTLCRHPLVDPLDTKCGHTFCSPCLKNHLAVQALCPVDRQIINYLECQQASNIVKRLLDKLPVACPNARFCDTIVYRSSLEEHLREWCPGIEVPCENASRGCMFEGPRAVQRNHRWKCPYMPNSSSVPDPIASAAMLSTTSDLRSTARTGVRTTAAITGLVPREDSSGDSALRAANFALKHPHQYYKEFPQLFPSPPQQPTTVAVTSQSFSLTPQQLQLQQASHERAKRDFPHRLPMLDETSDSPTIYEGIPVSIVICRPRDCMDLGFTFVGGLDTPLACILIQEIYLDGPAALDGRLRPGDQLLEVNGNLLTHVSHLEAQRLLTIPTPMVQLTVFREPVSLTIQQPTPTHYHQEIFHVKLYKRQGKVLGIKLVGKKHLPGLYVLELVAGCEADLDGRMRKDDQVLEINGVDFTNGTQEQAAQIINSASEYVVFKLSRRNRAATPDILRTTNDSNEKLDNLLALENLQLSSSGRSDSNNFEWPNSSITVTSSGPVNAINTAATSVSVVPSGNTSVSARSTNDLLLHSSTTEPHPQDIISSQSSCSSMPSPPSPPNLIANFTARSSQPVLEESTTGDTKTATGQIQNPVTMGSAIPSPKYNMCSPETGCQERTVIVNKSPDEPLGISIAGGRHSQRGDTPIYVTNISPECVLGRTKQVQRGDILLEANGVGLVGLTHNEAVEVLRRTSLLQTHIRLRLITAPETNEGPENFMPSWIYWLKLPPICQLARTVRLRRDPTPSYPDGSFSQPLGFSIVGGWGQENAALNGGPSSSSSSSSSPMPTNSMSVDMSPTQFTKKHKSTVPVGYTNICPCPIVIKSIVPGLLAHKDGRLKCGDLILSVNNLSMLNIPHSAAVRLLKQTRGDVVLQIISWPGTIV